MRCSRTPGAGSGSRKRVTPNVDVSGPFKSKALQHVCALSSFALRTITSYTYAMPICVECRCPVKTLYTEYSGADDKSSGQGVRLTVCRNCGRFCDKYVEHDNVVLFIDLVLIKPQVSYAPESDERC